MIKIIPPDAYDFGEPPVRLVKLARDGLGFHDRRALVKHASEGFAAKLARLERKPGDEVALNIALSTTEAVGPNRNGDGFRAEWCRRNHHTFAKHAFPFRDHRNRPDSPRYGYVKLSHFNEDMQRVELGVVYNATKEAAERNKGLVADLEMEKLAKGDVFPSSMACSLDPDALVLTAEGYRPISAVRVGDLVYTHERRWRRVTALRRRVYTGKAVRLRVEGMACELRLTGDHLLRAKRLAGYPGMRDGQRPVGQWKREVDGGQPAFSWLHCNHLEKDDRLEYVPVLRGPSSLQLSDVRLCGLLGIYCAEGSIADSKGNPNTVDLSIHVDDWAVRGVPEIVNDLWPETTCRLVPRKNTKFALALLIHSAEFARFTDRFVGRRCRGKRIPLELFGSDSDARAAFLGRWLDGDGWCDLKGGHWSSSSLPLVLQGRDLLASLGVPSSIYKIDHATCESSGMENSGVEYTLNVSNFDLGVLAPYSEKVAAHPHVRPAAERTKSPSLQAIGDGLAYRIKEVETFEVVDAPTWNLEVEEDHSYTLFGIGSHNCLVKKDICSGCQHEARSRREYCRGPLCKYGGLYDNIGRTFADGHHLHADNPDPDWFDISHIVGGRGADRTSFTLGLVKKAAEKVACGAQIADELGLAVPFLPDLFGPAVARHAKVACELTARDAADRGLALAFAADFSPPPAPAGPAKAAAAFRALADARVVLPVRAFLELAGATPKEAAAAAPAVAALVPDAYAAILADGDAGLASNPFVPAASADSAHRKWASALAASASLEPAAVSRRLALAAVRDASGGGAPRPSTSFPAAAAEPAARAYALYKIAALAAVPEADRGRLMAAARAQDAALA